MAQPLSTIGFNAGQSEKQSSESCINYIPFPTSANDLNGGQVSLYSTTGIKGPNTVSSPLIPSGFQYLYSTIYEFSGEANGNGWAYWNNHLVQFSSSFGRLINIPGIQQSQSSLAARFASSKSDLVVIGSTSGGASFCQKYDAILDSVTPVDISPINSSTAPGQNQTLFLSDVVFFSGRYFYATYANQAFDFYSRIYFSKVNDPDIENSNNFIGSIEDAGRMVGMHVLNGRLYAFAENKTFIYTQNNSTTIPIIEQQGSRLEFGLVAASAKAEVGGVLYFIGRSNRSIKLMSISGGSVSFISTPAVDYELSLGDWTEQANYAALLCRVYGFSDAGKEYVSFTFNNKTFCYDIATGLFHRRKTDVGSIGQSGQWDVSGSYRSSNNPDGQQCIAGMGIPQTPVGSNMVFNFGETDNSIGTEFGELVERTAISAPYNSNGVTNNVREIQVISDIDNDPLDPNWPEPNINLSTSKEYSYSFSPEKSRQFGEQGVRNRLLRWPNLGIFRQAFVIKLRTKHPYAHQIVKVLAQIEKGFRQR